MDNDKITTLILKAHHNLITMAPSQLVRHWEPIPQIIIDQGLQEKYVSIQYKLKSEIISLASIYEGHGTDLSQALLGTLWNLQSELENRISCLEEVLVEIKEARANKE